MKTHENLATVYDAQYADGVGNGAVLENNEAKTLAILRLVCPAHIEALGVGGLAYPTARQKA